MQANNRTPVVPITIEQDTTSNLNVKHWNNVDKTEPDEDNVETFCGGLCCLSGCLCVSVGSLYFFVFIPASIFLLISGSNNGNTVTLGLGIGLLVLFLVLIPINYLLWRHCRRKCKNRQKDYVIRTAYDNPQIVTDKS